jgi:hypothetical protein
VSAVRRAGVSAFADGDEFRRDFLAFLDNVGKGDFSLSETGAPSCWRFLVCTGFDFGGVFVTRCMCRGEYREERRARSIWERGRRQRGRRGDQRDELQLVKP